MYMYIYIHVYMYIRLEFLVQHAQSRDKFCDYTVQLQSRLYSILHITYTSNKDTHM